MNPVYTIMESPHRWLILAALSLAIGAIGAMAMIAYTWPHWLARAWLYLGILATLSFLVSAFVEWQRTPQEESSDSGHSG